MKQKKANKLLSDSDILALLSEASSQLEIYTALNRTSNLGPSQQMPLGRPKDWTYPIGLSFIKNI
ncbi:hypothetical protein [Polynucleobacter sp. Tro8-14-1]|jgi:hypothetical protein|uniref:hypothetical protein n=1 Tax=Polynucleobacter sp. Tro8-14-1 TaxID=1758383 RepID=UPI001C0D33EA|nr:hypothetical protein [Polynucleobacter sp. Tro8-14-1]MBU3562780.1 hypothetical protein [Polynucleobacter sp. Tro8-14-1]